MGWPLNATINCVHELNGSTGLRFCDSTSGIECHGMARNLISWHLTLNILQLMFLLLTFLLLLLISRPFYLFGLLFFRFIFQLIKRTQTFCPSKLYAIKFEITFE